MNNSKETLKRRNDKRRLLKETIDPKSFPHQIKRLCKDCGKMKLCGWLSSFNADGTPQYKNRCPECYNKLQRQRRIKR